MFAPYRSILSLPGARAFTFWGLLARAQMAMTELAILLMVQIEYGSYAVAGRVVAAVAISWALLAPFVGRLVDRYGQYRALRWGFAIVIVGRVGMIIAAVSHQPEWVLFAFAPLFPASGSIATYTRARWVYTVKNDDALNTAFSLESSLDETLFIVGPALTTVLATLVVSWAGLAISTLALAVGGYAFLAQRGTEPPIGEVAIRQARRRRPRIGTHMFISVPAVLITTVIFAAQGALFASADIATVAFADSLGLKSSSGPVLALFALGSLIGGLLYGSRVWRHSLTSRLTWGVVLTGMGAATFGLAPTLADPRRTDVRHRPRRRSHHGRRGRHGPGARPPQPPDRGNDLDPRRYRHGDRRGGVVRRVPGGTPGAELRVRRHRDRGRRLRASSPCSRSRT